MKPLPHLYSTHLNGGKSGYAVVGSEGLPDLRTAPPADFDGPGDAWSPEQFLMAAVETCFLFTFRAVAAASKLEFSAVEVKGEGTVDRKDGATRFTQIILRPRLTVPAGVDLEKARRIVEKSEKACLISASLNLSVQLDPEIVVA